MMRYALAFNSPDVGLDIDESHGVRWWTEGPTPFVLRTKISTTTSEAAHPRLVHASTLPDAQCNPLRPLSRLAVNRSKNVIHGGDY